MPGGWFLLKKRGKSVIPGQGDKGLPAEEEKITEGKRWTPLPGFVVRMRRVPTTANAGHAI